jgi:hypothetical protein
MKKVKNNEYYRNIVPVEKGTPAIFVSVNQLHI